MARLLERYKNEIVPALQARHGYTSPLAVPRLEKIVVSMGIGKAIENKNRIEKAMQDLAAISGQKPAVRRARVSVAGFKLRKGEAIGVMVTIRKKRMYEFLDRLICIVIPRIRDFRGLSPKGFDGRGNYNFGLSEQTVFPEVNADQVEFVQGMNVALCLTGGSDAASYEVLEALGMPFRK
jgi:large subunit ribosomal protein L5